MWKRKKTKRGLVPKQLRFVEQYIDEKPPEDDPNQWRGVLGYIDDEEMIRITFNPKRNRFDEEDHFDFDARLISSFLRKKMYETIKHTKEGAMAYAQEIFNEYVRSLCDEK